MDRIDPLAQSRARILRELEESAGVHWQYYQKLVAEGFTADQAFDLTRDHHQVFTWISIGPVDQVPAWLGTPRSSEQRSSTENVYSISKRPTPEQ